jgi:spore coat polysaccharide biosynthesis predicted glycosyltransferase SpsG
MTPFPTRDDPFSDSWIKDGANDLVVFDLYGNKPDQTKLIRYEAFSVIGDKLLSDAR